MENTSQHQMACYERFPRLCVIWCCVEILFFSGIVYGWSSLVFLFINEGFYSELCNDNKTQLTFSELNTFNTTSYLFEKKRNNSKSFVLDDKLYCKSQESRLGLWFSIGVGCTRAGMAVVGPLNNALGTRNTRIIIQLVYATGLLCLAFSTQECPWLICPGLSCIGLAGNAQLITNVQVANLFPMFSSTIAALLCGLYESSPVVSQIIKVAYGLGISHRTAFIFLACLYLLMTVTSTFFILPKSYIYRPIKDVEIQIKGDEDCKYTDSGIIEEKISSNERYKKPQESVRWYMMSLTYISHTTWMSLHTLFYAVFLSILHIRVEVLSRGEKSIASYYVGMFAYVTFGAVLGSLIAGIIYDAGRKKYRGSSFPSNTFRPVVVPLTACGVFITLVFGLMMDDGVTFLLPTFIAFTLFRTFLYSTTVAFVNEAFPTEYFAYLFGMMTFINGLFSLIQYGFVEWTVSYPDAYRHVHVVLILLAVITFLHPLQLWIRSVRSDAKGCNDQDGVSAAQTELLKLTKKDENSKNRQKPLDEE